MTDVSKDSKIKYCLKEACRECTLGLVCSQSSFTVTIWSCTRCGRKYASWGTRDTEGKAHMEEVNNCPNWEEIRRVNKCQWCTAEQNAGEVTNWEKESLIRISQRARYVKLD